MNNIRRYVPFILLFALAVTWATGCDDAESGPSTDVRATDETEGDVVDDAASDPIEEVADDPDPTDIEEEPDVSLEDAVSDPDAAADPDVELEPDADDLGEDCTNGEDDDDDERVDCHDPDCFDTEPCEGVNPAPFLEPVRWHRTWSDEFNGPVPGNEDCYDNATTPPQCLTLYWHNETCPEDSFANLADLNKCDWSVFYLYNWMSMGKGVVESVNAFGPEHVTVSGGTLILSAAANLSHGSLPGSWDIDRVMEEYDCGNPPETGYQISTDCPILAGGLWSKQMGAVTGLLQTYGRFEIRARLPVGVGSWPAHWMLPQEGPWPGDGEIDIMEATNHQPNFTPHDVAANFHDGVIIGEGEDEIRTHMSVGAMSQDMSIEQQTDEYHIYSVEWEAEELRFFVDDILIGTVVEGTMLTNKDLETGDEVGDFPLEVPDEDFHMILNSTITAFGDDDYPDPRTFTDQYHYIDYVRAWEVCDDLSDSCPHGGTFDGANCRVGPVPAMAGIFIHEDDLVYAAFAGDDACNPGDERRGDLCVIYEVDADVHTFIWGDSFYIQTACLESTLSDSPRCYQPCGGYGRYDGADCYVGAPPEGARAQVVDDTFVYRPFTDGGERCPVGRDWGAWCEIGAVPEGRTGRVNFDGDAMYISRLCNPAEFMPNCPQPCPEGAEWDGEDCYVSTPPPDSDPFVYQGGFYYNRLNADTYANVCPIGVDDSVHCYVGPAPEGWTPMIENGWFYVEAACDNVRVIE